MTERQLNRCNSGETGIITKIENTSTLSTRLQELGVLPGQWIRVVRAGNPMIFQVGDSRFCVRANQLHGVSVHPLPNDRLRPDPEPVSTFSEELSSAPSARRDG